MSLPDKIEKEVIMKFRILSLLAALALAVPPVPTAAAETENSPRYQTTARQMEKLNRSLKIRRKTP